MKKILIIEDDPDIVDLIEIHLKDLHCLVDKCYDGEKGLEMALSGDYNLIVLDLMLPGIGGLATLEKIQSLDQDIVVVMITAFASIENAVRATKLGAFDFVTKPFDTKIFLQKVEKLIGK